MLILFTHPGSPRDDRRMSDDEVAAQIKLCRDDPEAFAVIIDRFSPLVYTVARGIFSGCRQSDLDDAVSETFLKLWRTREQYDPARGSYANYVLVTTRAVCLSSLRRLYREGKVQIEAIDEIDWDSAPPADDPEAALIDRIDGETVRAVLDALPADDRELIVCKYFCLMRVRDIARRTHRTEKSVEARLYKLRLTLREEFTRRGLRP